MRFFSSLSFKYIVIVVIAMLLYKECVIKRDKDFDIFIGASKLISNGKICYDTWILSGTSGLKYYYSPLFAVLLFPFKDLPQIAYYFIWLSINLILVYRIFKLLPIFLNIDKLTVKQKEVFYLLTGLASARFFFDTFSLGQMTFVLVWGSLEALRLVLLDKLIKGAALLGLIVNIKLIPVGVLAYLFYVKKIKAGVYTSLFFLLFLILPAPLIGFHFNNELLSKWFNTITSTTSESIMDDYGRQSLSSFIPALLMDTPVQFDLKRNFISLLPQQVNLILTLVRLTLMIMLLFLFGNPFRKIISKKEFFYHLSLICLITPLFFPHQGKYSFFYLLPGQAYCVYSLIKLKGLDTKMKHHKIYKKTLTFFVLSFILLTLTTDGLIGRRLSNLCEYLQFITLGSFCLLFAMTYLKPKVNF